MVCKYANPQTQTRSRLTGGARHTLIGRVREMQDNKRPGERFAADMFHVEAVIKDARPIERVGDAKPH